MNNPLVSIVILSYNNNNYIFDAINSVLSQTYSNIELIISDDGTKDFDVNFIIEYVKSNKNSNITDFKVIHHENNIGTVKNYNNAIANSKGELICGLAADDVLYNTTVIEEVVNFFIEKNALIITAYRDVYDNNLNNFIERLPTNKQVKIIKENKKLYKKLCKGNFISGACTYYSRKFFHEYGLFDEEYLLVEDYPKYLNITRKGCKIFFLEKPVIKYRLGGVSTGQKSNKLVMNDMKKVVEKEILLYKQYTGLFIYRLKKANLICESNKYKLLFYYPDIFLYKILTRIKKIILKVRRY